MTNRYLEKVASLQKEANLFGIVRASRVRTGKPVKSLVEAAELSNTARMEQEKRRKKEEPIRQRLR